MASQKKKEPVRRRFAPAGLRRGERFFSELPPGAPVPKFNVRVGDAQLYQFIRDNGGAEFLRRLAEDELARRARKT